MVSKEPIKLLPNSFTPRHMRRGAVNKSGTVDQTKSRAFRRCKRISDQFIHQSSDALEGPKLKAQYERYCNVTRAGSGFRK